ncbi:MAG: hypothetical protein IKI12_07780, partial [Lachnospiraceae bacterium]|nr:hypothetical protein [Lachnospiraceae bacterium]
PLRGSLMLRIRGASRLARPGKENRFWSERKRPDLQDDLFPGVLNSYKIKTIRKVSVKRLVQEDNYR